LRNHFLGRGIIVKHAKGKEADAFVWIFTYEFGPIRMIAKNLRHPNSRRAGHIDHLNLVRYLAVPREGSTYLVQIESENSFPRIKADLYKARIGYTIMELILQLTPIEQEDKPLFTSLLNTLVVVEKANNRTYLDKTLINFQQYLLRHLGYPLPPIISEYSLRDQFLSITENKLFSSSIDVK